MISENSIFIFRNVWLCYCIIEMIIVFKKDGVYGCYYCDILVWGIFCSDKGFG